MKNLFKSIMMVAVAAISFTSCSNNFTEEIVTGEKIQFNVSAVNEEVTRSAFGEPSEGKYPTLWSGDEGFALNINGADGKTTSDVTATFSGDKRAVNLSADIEFETAPETYTLYAIAPATAYVSVQPSGWQVTIPTSQTTGTLSCDPKAQILVGASKTKASASETFDMTFKHAVAYGKMTLKNLALNDAKISSVAITSTVNIAGRFYINQATREYSDNSGAKTITVNTTSTDNIWFALAPVDVSNTELKIVVNTDKGTFTKTVNMPANRKFELGKISTFNVDMGGIELAGPVETATFVFNQASGSTADTITRTDGPITCVVAKAGGSYAPNEHKDGHLRFQAGNTITISGATITNVQFEFTDADHNKNISANVGTYTKGTTSSTWTGSASEVVFTNDDGSQARVESVTVTYVATGQEKQTLLFDSEEVSANLGEPFTAPNLSGAMTTVKYSSSNTDVAEVDVNTGKVTLKGAGTTTIKATAVESEKYYGAEASYTLTVIDPNATVDYTIENKSNVTLSTTGGTSASTAKVKVDGHEYAAIKLGTSKAAGAREVTVPAGTTKLHLHLAGWNGANVKVGVTGATVDKSSLSLISDSGITGNSPFTLSTTNSSSFYHELTLSNVTEATTLTFTATSGKRFVVWGVNAEIPE